MPDFRIAALVAITTIVGLGTLSSVVHNSYLDTSNPLLTALPHPLHATDYFANKKNVLNVYFIKRIWGWTTVAFLALFLTAPPATRTIRRVAQYTAATAVFLGFTSWFFGPAVLERLIVSTGGECVVNLPSGVIVGVPNEFCYTKSTISAGTHPALFPAAVVLPDADWRAIPRLRRGHDVSGHIFLLTMSTLFLVDQLRASFLSPTPGARRGDQKWPPYHTYAVAFTAVMIALALFASYTTSVYFHTPIEKLTGYLLGIAGFAVTQIPILRLEEPQSTARRDSVSPPRYAPRRD